MSDFGEDGFGRCRGCSEWTRHESVMLAGMALCTRCSSATQGPDHLHRALASVLGAHHWWAFCDAWLAIGLAALWPATLRISDGRSAALSARVRADEPVVVA